MSEKVNLQRSYSSLNERLAKLFDESGVRRSFTIPYIDGQKTDEHIQAVGQVAAQAGGLTNNLVTSSHHSTGKGWGTGDGHTVGHPSEKLRATVIPQNDENAKSAIEAAQKYLTDVAKLVGDDDPTIVVANHQLDLVKKTDGSGMNLLDFGVMLTQIMSAPTQAVARAHSGTKDGGHSPQLRAPGAQAAQESTDEPQGEAPAAGQASEGQEAAPAAQAAPAANATPSGAAPAAAQAQG